MARCISAHWRRRSRAACASSSRPGSGIELQFDDIVRITPIEASLWQRMDGHVDLGFSFAKADLETRYTLNADTEYKSKRYEGDCRARLADHQPRRRRAAGPQPADAVRKPACGAALVGGAIVQFQQNEELSIDLRTVAGAGVTRYLAQSNRTNLTLFGGLAYTREQFTGEEPTIAPKSWWAATGTGSPSRTTTSISRPQVLSFFSVTGGSRSPARVTERGAVRVPEGLLFQRQRLRQFRLAAARGQRPTATSA